MGLYFISWWLSIVVSVQFAYSSASTSSSMIIPEYFNIGIMFSIEVNNAPSHDLHFFSAILMAIDQINNKTDGIYDNILPSTQLKTIFRPCENKFFLGATEAHSLLEVDPLHDVMANIGPFGNYTLQGAVPTFQEANKIPVLGFRDRSAVLGYSRFYPNFLRAVPGIYTDGYAIAMLVSQYFRWDKVTVFSCMTDSSRGSMTTFSHWATTLGIHILSTQTLENSRVDMTNAILSAKRTGARIIILFLDPGRAKMVIEQGLKLNLLTANTQIIGGEELVTASTWSSMNLSSSVLDTLLAGVIGVRYHRYSPSSSLKDKFLHHWVHHHPTDGDVDANGNPVCDTRMDSYNSSYLHQYYPFNNHSSTPVCAGTDYSAFSNHSNISDHLLEAMYAYDATLSVAMGLHHLVYFENKTTITPADLHDTLLYDVSFVGLTGLVSYSTEMVGDEFDVGGRSSEILYDIVNYVASTDSDGEIAFRPVLEWHSELGFTPCGEINYYQPDNPCHHFTFQTVDGSVPSDSPSKEIQEMSTSHRSVLRVLSAVGIISSIFVFIVIYSYYSRRLVKISQPLLANFKKSGIFIGFIRVLVSSFEVTPTLCNTQLWLEHLAFQLIFLTISVRCWRVYLVTASFKKIKITDYQCLKLIVTGLVGIVVLLIVNTILDTARVNYVTVTKNQFEYIQQPVCVYPSDNMIIVMYSYDLLILSVGLFYCWLIRKVGTAVSNTPALVEGFLTTTVSIIGLSILLGVVKFLPIEREFITSLIICLLLLRILWVFEHQIIYHLLAGYELDRSLILHKSEKNILELWGIVLFQAKVMSSGDDYCSTSSITQRSEQLTSPGTGYLLKYNKYDKLKTRDEIIMNIDRVRKEFEEKRLELTSLENMLFTVDQDSDDVGGGQPSSDHATEAHKLQPILENEKCGRENDVVEFHSTKDAYLSGDIPNRLV